MQEVLAGFKHYEKRELRMKTRAIIRDTIGPDIWCWKSPVYGLEF